LENGRSSSLAENIVKINKRVSEALSRSEDSKRDVRMIAVSKTFPAERISEALHAGLFRFGENRVQEILSKSVQLSNKRIEWHFIGHLQTNKIKKLLEVPTKYIHSVDRLEVAVELESQLQKRGESREILVEVNTSGETTKSGVRPDKTIELVKAVAKFSTIKIKGLMTIGTLMDDIKMVHRCFATLRELSRQIRKEAIDGVEMLELSMGMSGDFEIAVEEGATMIRIGSALFGQRER